MDETIEVLRREFDAKDITAGLRVSQRSVERWRKAWRERGREGVLSRRSPGRPRLGPAQTERPERELERGPLAHGWPDQRWTLARIKTLTVFQLPAYAPVLNPQEGIWSLVKREIGNLAAAGLSQVTRAVKRELKQIQYQPDVIDGRLAGTGLALGT